jgi:phosphoglycolate phosphatase-like HAD superfamily hydrolase
MNEHRHLVALDFDGTLVSCYEKQIYALQRACALQETAYTEYDRFWDLKRRGSSTQKALRATGIDEKTTHAIAACWVDIVETRDACERDVLLPGVVDALSDLTSHADVMLLSARRDSSLLEYELNALGLLQFFTHWETVSPSAGVGNAKAERLRYRKACCYVGDTESDLLAAQAASLPFYLLCTGQRSKEFFEQNSQMVVPRAIYGNFQHVANDIKHELLS